MNRHTDPHDPLSSPAPTDEDYPLGKPDEAWRDQLSETEYEVTRHAATERPFTGRYWDHWERGIYDCVCCGTPLFESSTKFDAGCGWPSYFKPIDGEVIEERTDRSHGMLRIEVRCKHCGAHLGHVFEDGPAPTGLRHLAELTGLLGATEPPWYSPGTSNRDQHLLIVNTASEIK